MSYRMLPGQVPKIVHWDEKDQDQCRTAFRFNEQHREMGWLIGDDYQHYVEIGELWNYTTKVQELWNENTSKSRN